MSDQIFCGPAVTQKDAPNPIVEAMCTASFGDEPWSSSAIQRWLLVVGAYSPSGTYDECNPNAQEHKRAVKRVDKVVRPRKDP